MEAYESVCEKLPKLCPRLVPAPLWGYSLANFARMDPLIAKVICEDCDKAVEIVKDFWFKQERGKCSVCGEDGSDLDEDWRYYVDGQKGISELVGIRVLCKKCHLAKHQGYAKVNGKSKEALEQLAKINGVSSVKDLVENAFSIHFELSKIFDWTFKLSALSEPLRGKAEKLLNTAYKNNFLLKGNWLYYIGKNHGKIEEESIGRTIQLLKSNKDLLYIAISSVSEKATVLINEFNTFIKMINDTLEKLKRSENILMAEYLTGKWMIFVKKDIYPKFFKRIIEVLGDEVYELKIDYGSSQFHSNKELPVIVYVPSALDFEYIIKVEDSIKKVMKEFNINKDLFFKPDIFTEKGIYSGNSELKPYIYFTSVQKRKATAYRA